MFSVGNRIADYLAGLMITGKNFSPRIKQVVKVSIDDLIEVCDVCKETWGRNTRRLDERIEMQLRIARLAKIAAAETYGEQKFKTSFSKAANK